MPNLSDLIEDKRKLNVKPKPDLIDIDDIIPNQMNNKIRVERNLNDLKESIRENGLINPLAVYDNNDGTYQCH
ncbi:MAG: ParB/Srx family N-terminal domain-containing protein [Erysipelotrichaceae bacterium]|nr:ParB/Srx family N-terminal domain-containing protein [Erysipelotrichaceae bacterium]